MRRCAILTAQLEVLEVRFAVEGVVAPETLDLYGRVLGNLRRTLEAVGLQRRQRTIGPTLDQYLRHDRQQVEGEAST